MEKRGFVYIMSNKKNGTLYSGVTSDLIKRVYEHKSELADGFTKKYGLKTLVYYEIHDDFRYALQREKNLKHWVRQWKIDLIVNNNPDWNDLYDEICQ